MAVMTLLLLAFAAYAADGSLTSPSQDVRANLTETSDRITLSFELAGIPLPGDRNAAVAEALPGGLNAPPQDRLLVSADGETTLPRLSRYVVVPANRGLRFEFRAVEPEYFELTGDPPQLAEGANGDLYPEQCAEMSAPILIRGVRLAQITVHPLQYDRVNRRWLKRDRIETEIVFTDDAPVNPVEHPNRRMSADFLRYIRALAMNGDAVWRDDPEVISEYLGHYLIVTHEACLQHAIPFIEWRRQSGYKVDVIALPDNEAANSQSVVNAIRERYNDYLEAGEEPFDMLLLIGDRPAYNAGPNPQYRLESVMGESQWQQFNHADYLLGALEGDDNVADVGVARWPTGTNDLMRMVVNKTLQYEGADQGAGENWENRGTVFLQHDGHNQGVYFHKYMAGSVRWSEELLRRFGVAEIDAYEQLRFDRDGEELGPWLRDRYNEGNGVVLGVGGNMYWRRDVQGMDYTGVYPVQLAVGSHSNWVAETMFRSGDPMEPLGPVASASYWGDPTIKLQMTTVWMGMVNGMFAHDLPLGWSRVFGVNIADATLAPENHHARADFECFGDPGLQPWRGVPLQVEVTSPDVITPATRLLTAVVTDFDGARISGAQATLYHPGEIPDDPDDYPAYDGFRMRTTTTDGEGRAIFLLEDLELETGILKLTVTGRNIKPSIGEITVAEARDAVEIAGYSLTEITGDGDENVNPGESFSLSLACVNLSAEVDLQDVTAVVSCESPWVEVGDNQVHFGDLASGESAESNGGVRIDVAAGAPDGASQPSQKPLLLIAFSSGEESWESAILLDPHAPGFEFVEVVDEAPIDTLTALDVVIRNVGRRAAPALAATLRSRSPQLQVVEARGGFSAIEPGEAARLEGDLFQVAPSSLAVPGTVVPMELALAGGDDFADALTFDLTVRRPGRNMPQPPDRYGYVCFDDTDQDWDAAPEYEWIEINPGRENPELEGNRCDFPDDPNDLGVATVVEPDFPVTFYGEAYEELTICSNGFLALGRQPRVTNYQPWPMHLAMGGGVGMIAPFWMDLAIAEGGAVFTAYDEERHIFVVEWDGIPLRTEEEITATFQVVFYDPRFWITESGDGPIKFQYKSIQNRPNQRERSDVVDLRFASVGISSPGGYGSSYTWNNAYPVTSAPLENRRAILYATSPANFRAAILHGHIYDFETRRPIPNALLYTSYGFVANSDGEGYYIFREALADVPFDLHVRAQGYNDSLIADTLVNEGDTLEVDFYLLHPDFALTREEINARVSPGRPLEIPFRILNDGNGPLVWQAERRLFGDANAEAGELRRTLAAGDSVDDDRCEGVVFANDRFYVSGANQADPSLIYVLDREGELIRTFEQAGTSRYGMKDLEWDGELLWGSGDTAIFGFTTEGEVEFRWRTPMNPCNNIAYDSERDLLWLSGITTNILGCTRNGEIVDTLNRKGFRMYGMSYYPDDPDGYDLYLIHVPGQDQPDQVYKMNIETGDTAWVWGLTAPEAATGTGGCWITNGWDVYSWVMMTVANVSPGGGGDRIEVYQLERRMDWFNLDLNSGRIEAGERQTLTLTLCADGLPEALFESEIAFYSNAGDGRNSLHISMDVTGEDQILMPFDLLSPEDGDTIRVDFGPINENDSLQIVPTEFVWGASLNLFDPEIPVEYRLTLTAGMGVWDTTISDTSIEIDLFQTGLPFVEGAPVIWFVTASSLGHDLESMHRFTFRLLSNSDGGAVGVPAQFGIAGVYPNPFNAATTISFGLTERSRAKLTAYDALGREVAEIFDGSAAAGYHRIGWNAGGLPAGVYILRLEAGGRKSLSKVAILK